MTSILRLFYSDLFELSAFLRFLPRFRGGKVFASDLSTFSPGVTEVTDGTSKSLQNIAFTKKCRHLKIGVLYMWQSLRSLSLSLASCLGLPQLEVEAHAGHSSRGHCIRHPTREPGHERYKSDSHKNL